MWASPASSTCPATRGTRDTPAAPVICPVSKALCRQGCQPPLDLLRLPPLAFAPHSRALACSSSSCQVGLLPSCPIRTKWSRPYFVLRANPPLRDRSVRRRCRSTSSTRILPSLLLGYHILRRARERCARVGILLGYAVPRAPPSTNVPRGRNLDFVVKRTGPSPFDG